MDFSWIISIITNPQWVTALATVFLGIVTLLVVWVALFKEDIIKPLIKIGFGNSKPYVIDSYGGDTINLLFRLKIVNQGKIVAKKCRVKIVSVVAEDDDKKISLIEEPDTLRWSSSPKDTRYHIDSNPIYRETKDVTPKGGWEFCDLFSCWSKNSRINFASSGKRDFLSEKSKNYIATIEISGDNLKPTKKEIKFSVPHKFDWEKQEFLLAGIKEVRDSSK